MGEILRSWDNRSTGVIRVEALATDVALCPAVATITCGPCRRTGEEQRHTRDAKQS